MFNKSLVGFLAVVGLLIILIGCADTDGDADGEGYLSPAALAGDAAGGKLYIAESSAKRIAVFDIASGKVTKEISLPNNPTGLALSPDRSHLYVTGGVSPGQVHIVNTKTGRRKKSVSAGHSPVSPVLSPDGKMLYVCDRFGNSVLLLDVNSMKEAGRIAVSHEPVAAAITGDGKFLFVANMLPAGSADGDYAAAVVSVIDTAAKKTLADIQLPNGSTSLKGICISPDGLHVYVTHILARYQLPTTQLERGWVNTNALSVIDVESKSLLNTVLLDDVDLGAANPWGVACTADGKHICVTHAGTHELSIIDRQKLTEKLTRAAAGEKVSDVTSSASDVPNDLSFLVGIRKRIGLKGNGPRNIAIVGAKVYITEYFTDSLAIVDTDTKVAIKAKSLSLGPKQPMTTLRKGEMLFNDAKLCFQQWHSCASCHPGDARVDGLNWDLLNDGLGNPKNTKSMLLSHSTPPVMATGIRATAELGVRAGIKHILFATRPEEDPAAIDEYLKSLKPVPSPHLVKGKLSKAAKRGKKIFVKANCSVCHTEPLYTDLKKYDVGTGKRTEKGMEFDTPTLVEMWRTGPYLHDGRAANIAEVLTKFNPDDKHGTTSSLTPEQISDLTEFILSK